MPGGPFFVLKRAGLIGFRVQGLELRGWSIDSGFRVKD